MRRLQERLLGHRWYTAANASAGSEIWVLGLCYKVSANSSNEALSAQAFEEFLLDFSSRIWISYRKGFECVGQSKCVSDVGWGCMLCSGKMLLAQVMTRGILDSHLRKSTCKSCKALVTVSRAPSRYTICWRRVPRLAWLRGLGLGLTLFVGHWKRWLGQAEIRATRLGRSEHYLLLFMLFLEKQRVREVVHRSYAWKM